MRLVIQRVNHAQVTVQDQVVGKIGKGFLVLSGVSQQDTKEIADKYLKKLLGLRIFEDENGKTNLSLRDVSGELLLISQFTLYAPASSRQELRIWRMSSMNIWLRKRGRRSLSCRPAVSENI